MSWLKNVDIAGVFFFIFLSIAISSMSKCTSEVTVAEQQRYFKTDSLKIVFKVK